MFLLKHTKQFRQSRRNSFGTNCSFLFDIQNVFCILIFFSKRFFFEMFQGHVEFSFDSHNEVVWGGLIKMFHSISEILRKTSSFYRKVFLFEMFLWKHREQFGEPGRNFSDNGPNFSWSTLKQVTKNTIFLNRYKVFLGTRRMRVWQHGRINFNNWP